MLTLKDLITFLKPNADHKQKKSNGKADSPRAVEHENIDKVIEKVCVYTEPEHLLDVKSSVDRIITICNTPEKDRDAVEQYLMTLVKKHKDEAVKHKADAEGAEGAKPAKTSPRAPSLRPDSELPRDLLIALLARYSRHQNPLIVDVRAGAGTTALAAYHMTHTIAKLTSSCVISLDPCALTTSLAHNRFQSEVRTSVELAHKTRGLESVREKSFTTSRAKEESRECPYLGVQVGINVTLVLVGQSHSTLTLTLGHCVCL